MNIFEKMTDWMNSKTVAILCILIVLWAIGIALMLQGCLLLTFSENEYLVSRWDTVVADGIKTTTATFGLRDDAPAVEVDSLRFWYDVKLAEKDSAGWVDRRIGVEEGVEGFALTFIYPDSIWATFTSSVRLHEGIVPLEVISQSYTPVQTWENIKP